MTDEPTVKSAQAVAAALLALGGSRPELAARLSSLIAAIADEAARTPRFANSLQTALSPSSAELPKARRTGRRAPGVVDPFGIYNDTDEQGLRERLSGLDLEQLRDIVAEHGMDHDRLAMKWKDHQRVINRIVEKVVSRTSKGSAFRPETN
ncbi:hypothetical protein ABIB49_001514 [Arthrobacter sp. UYCu512]|uniref:hypothetical protein n=1 Tax=Arthrobacter sp. UYCu512 TaxID=3156338 RepID=UPI003394A85E